MKDDSRFDVFRRDRLFRIYIINKKAPSKLNRKQALAFARKIIRVTSDNTHLLESTTYHVTRQDLLSLRQSFSQIDFAWAGGDCASCVARRHRARTRVHPGSELPDVANQRIRLQRGAVGRKVRLEQSCGPGLACIRSLIMLSSVAKLPRSRLNSARVAPAFSCSLSSFADR